MGKTIQTVYLTVRVDINRKGEGSFTLDEAEEVATDITFPPTSTDEYEMDFTLCGVNDF